MTVTINPGDNWSSVLTANPAETDFIIASGTHRGQSLTNTTRTGLTLRGETNKPLPIVTGGTIISGVWTKVSGVNRWFIGGQTYTPSTFTTTYPIWFQDGYERSCRTNVVVTFSGTPAWHRDTIAEATNGAFYYFDYAADTLYVGIDPATIEIEMSTTTYLLTGSVNNITVRGLYISMYANAPQTGAIYGRNTSTSTYSSGWLVERCIFENINGCGTRHGNTMNGRRNFYLNCGQMGYQGNEIASPILETNLIYFNNFKGFDYGWEAGAGKFSETTDALIRWNKVKGNLGKGLWTDIDNIRTKYWENAVFDNQDFGIYHELSFTGVIAFNDTRRNGAGVDFRGDIRARDSTFVDVIENFVVATTAISNPWSVTLNQSERRAVTDCRISRNTIVLPNTSGRWGEYVQADGALFVNNVFEYNNTIAPNTTGSFFRKKTADPATMSSIAFSVWQGTWSYDEAGSISTSFPAGYTDDPPYPVVPRTYKQRLRSLPQLHRLFMCDEASGNPVEWSPWDIDQKGTIVYNGTMTYQNKAYGDGGLAARFTRANSNRIQYNQGNWDSAFNRNNFTYHAAFSLFDPAGVTTQRIHQIGSTTGAGLFVLWVGKNSTANQMQALLHLNGTTYGTTFTISDTNWHEIWITNLYSAGSGRIEMYLDGVSLYGANHTTDASVLTMTSVAAVGSSGTSNHFDGWIYAAGLWNEAFSIANANDWLYNYNVEPTVTGLADRSDPESGVISIPVIASGAAGETLSYTAEGFPAGVTINASSGLISGTINSAGAGRYRPVVIIADNGLPTAREAVLTWDWIVTDAGSLPSIDRVALINCDTGLEVVGYTSLTDGVVINLTTLGLTNVSMRVHTLPAPTGSVKFGLVNGLINNATYRIESVSPYSLAGDTSGGTVYNPFTDYQLSVSNQLTVTPYTASGATGSAGTPFVFNFTITVDTPPPVVTSAITNRAMQLGIPTWGSL